MSAFPQAPLFAFLGDRDYLHGSTLFETLALATEARSGRLEAIDFMFHRRTANRVTIVNIEPEEASLVVATFTYASGKLWAVGTDTPIVGREPYDEKALAAHFTMKDRRIDAARSGLTRSFGSVVIAAFKALLAKEEPNFRAVFVRMKLTHVPAGDFSITYTRMIGGRFFEGRIEAEGSEVGFIYFGIWS